MEFSGQRNRRRHRHRLFHSLQGTLVLFVPGLLLWPLHTMARQSAVDKDVRAVLERQVAAWNNGSIEGYMEGYWDSDSTVFTSDETVTRGYRNVLERYKKSYSNRETMGHLELRDITVESLSPTVALAMGIWELTRSNDKPWGRFTLILEKKPEGWRITHDHTSSARK